MDKINDLKLKLEQFQAKSAAKEEIKALVTLTLQILKKYKDSFDTLSAENIATIKQSIAYLEEINAKAINSHDTKTNAMMGQFDAKIALLKALIAKVKTIKPIDGIDGKDGKDGLDGFDGKDGSPDKRLQIVEKINTGKKDDLKIEAKQVAGFDKIGKDIEARAISILDQRTQFLINKTVKHDSTLTGSGTDADPLSAPGDVTATWGSIVGTLSNQTDLNSALGAKQDTLVSGTNIKTINLYSLLGAGNLTIAGQGGGTDVILNPGDDIQGSLDAIYIAGGGTVYLNPGTYTLTADIFIPSGCTLQGISRDTVIIDCNLLYSIQLSGTNAYSTGNVTIANGGTAVIGSGTTWTTGMVGQFIYLDGIWYEILARVSNTELTIDAYIGADLTNASYVLADTNFASNLNKLTLINATGSGVVSQYSQEIVLNDLIIYDCGTGIETDYCVYPKINVSSTGNGINLDMNYTEGFYIDFSDFGYSTTGAGVVMTNCRNATFFNSSGTDCFGNGISMTSCSKIAFISVDVSGNGVNGMEFISGNNDNQITDAIFDGNLLDGIKFTATSDRNQIVGSSITNNGAWGINIAAATCDNNIINNASYSGNVSGTISNSGTNTEISSGTNTGDYVQITVSAIAPSNPVVNQLWYDIS